MDVQYKANANVAPAEMQLLAESVGFGAGRSPERNKIALAGSIFTASARYEGKLVGLLRLVGDGAYILHMADLEVHPDFQRKGVGRRLMEMALSFAQDIETGTDTHLGEFTLFANTGADTFYEQLGFILAPNGMVLTDTERRREHELGFQKEWRDMRTQGAGSV